MKEIVFLRQGLENFCNHIEPVEIDFTQGSITLITGPNGIGKTSIFQAIAFTLYGVCEKGRGSDVLNNKTQKNCHTWTIFTINGLQYRVDRYVDYVRIGNSVTITKGDEDKPYKKGHKDVLPEIERLLMPYKLFINTLLFSQKVKTFFTDLTDSDQKEIFRKIMTLDDFVLYHKQSGVTIRLLESEITELNQNITVNNSLIDQHLNQIEEIKRQKKEFEEQKKKSIETATIVVSGIESKIEEKRRDLGKYPEDLEIKIQDLKTNLGKCSSSLNSLSATLDSKLSVIRAHGSQKEAELNKKLMDEQSKFNDAFVIKRQEHQTELGAVSKRVTDEADELKRQLSAIEMEIQNHQHDQTYALKQIDELTIDTTLSECPTCKQQISSECIEHLEKKKDEYKSDIQKSKQCIVQLKAQHKDLVSQIHAKQKEYDDEFKRVDEILNVLEQSRRDRFSELQERLTIALNKVKALVNDQITKANEESYDEKQRLTNEINSINHIIGETQKQISGKRFIENEINELTINLTQAKSALESHKESKFDDSLKKGSQEEIKSLNEKLIEFNTKLTEKQKELLRATFWKTGFSTSGIQSMLIDEAIPFMNRKIKYYMDLLCGGRYTVTFDTLKATKGNKDFRDKISVDVFDNETHSDKRVKFSGGQTRLVDIATILTLSDLMANIQNVKINIILFDEIFDALDDENIRYVSNLLRIAAQNKWVGIISHRHIDQIEADTVLNFR